MRKEFGVDPTTTERVYPPDEVEFMLAMHEYRETKNRPFPTWSEALRVAKALGYQKAGPDVPLPVVMDTCLPLRRNQPGTPGRRRSKYA
jgi:hypothetical protein